jgi:hypothetical protein
MKQLRKLEKRQSRQTQTHYVGKVAGTTAISQKEELVDVSFVVII